MSYLTEQNIDSPLSRWQFEEVAGSTIDDDLTATRDGTISGTVTLNQAQVFTDGGLGADFDGSTGYVSFGDASGLLGIRTVEVVAQFDTIPASAANPLFSHSWAGGQIIPLALGFNLDAANPGKLQVGYFTGSVWITATWATAPQTGTPYHIVGKYDGTTLKLRANGAEVATTTVGTARPGAGSVNATAYIGRRWDLGQFHDGKIWDVAIYSTALSDARVDAHFLALANPFNDTFGSAGAALAPLSVSGIDTTGWGTEGSEPGGLFNTGWATFAPLVTGLYQLSTVGSNYDTVINVYTGTLLTNLVLVATDDDSGGSGTSKLATTLNAGTTYYIQVGAKAAGGGTMSFSLNPMSDARLAAISAEAVTNSDTAPSRRLAAISAETLVNASNGSPSRQLAALSVEVLVPARLTFIGWGAPIKPPIWS